MANQKSKLIYAQLKNGRAYTYVWLGNDTFAKEFAEWDHDSHEGKWKDMYEFDEKISYYFDHDEFKKVSDILGWDVEEGLEDAEIVEYETEDINWVVTGSGVLMKNLSNETSNALFNAYDIRKTIESHSLGDIKRVHGGTDNDNTLEDLIHDLVYFLERLDESLEEIK